MLVYVTVTAYNSASSSGDRAMTCTQLRAAQCPVRRSRRRGRGLEGSRGWKSSLRKLADLLIVDFLAGWGHIVWNVFLV